MAAARVFQRDAGVGLDQLWPAGEQSPQVNLITDQYKTRISRLNRSGGAA